MCSFEYIAPFWYQQEALEPDFLIRKDRRGNLCIQRGECANLTKYTAKYPDLPTYYSLLWMKPDWIQLSRMV
jgi:hypothetical protein